MLLYRVFRAILFFLSKAFFRLEVKGNELIPKEGGFVLASNHASFLDPIILGVACPRLLNFAAKDTLFKNRLFGALLLRVGAFPIRRWSADIAAIRESVRRLQNNFGLVVFPEGSRNNSGEMQNVSSGFVLIADKANVPIVPAWISGSDRAWGKGMKIIRPAKIKVVFGNPVYPDILEDKQDGIIRPERKRLFIDVAQDITKLIKRLSSF